MKSVYVLYHTKTDAQEFNAGRFSQNLSRCYNMQINIKTCHPLDIIPTLRADPNYNLVIIHLSTPEGAYRMADTIKGITSAVLVAESTVNSTGYSENEVLEHFDKLIGPLNEGNFEQLLKEYGFLRPKTAT